MNVSFFAKYDLEKKKQSLKGVAWWQKAWDLHSRSRVRVRTCTSYKSLGQPRFYSLIWAHKVRFPRGGVSSNKIFFLEKTIIQIAVILSESIIADPKSKFTLVNYYKDFIKCGEIMSPPPRGLLPDTVDSFCP
jgi:hypothetical protein